MVVCFLHTEQKYNSLHKPQSLWIIVRFYDNHMKCTYGLWSSFINHTIVSLLTAQPQSVLLWSHLSPRMPSTVCSPSSYVVCNAWTRRISQILKKKNQFIQNRYYILKMEIRYLYLDFFCMVIISWMDTCQSICEKIYLPIDPPKKKL